MSIILERELKNLLKQKKDLEKELQYAKEKYLNSQKEYETKLNIFNKIKNQIFNLNKTKSQQKLNISEHAYLRYFERYLKFNLKEIEEEIFNGFEEDTLNFIKDSKKSTLIHPNGFKLIIRNNTVVTIEN